MERDHDSRVALLFLWLFAMAVAHLILFKLGLDDPETISTLVTFDALMVMCGIGIFMGYTNNG